MQPKTPRKQNLAKKKPSPKTLQATAPAKAAPRKSNRKPAPNSKIKTPPKQTPELIDAVEPQPKNRARIWYMVLGGAAFVVLAACAVLAHKHSLTGWEARAFYDVNHWQAPQWVVSQIAKPISDAVWGLVGLTAVALLVPKVTARAWRYVVPAVCAYGAAFVIEHIIERARPEELLGGMSGAGHDLVLRAHQGGAGFPSGHVAVLSALALTLWPFVSWPWRVLLGLLIIAEAWSRVFLGVHAPLDVIGGFAVGVVTVACIRLAPRKLQVWLRLD